MFPETTFTDLARRERIEDAALDFTMDEDAFRAFYERTARGLWSYLARITGDRQLADDLLQETFYRFLRAGASYDGEAHRRNSLYRIATNLARDARRRSATRAEVSAHAEDIEAIGSGRDARSTERRAGFNEAMAQLKPRERAMLWLAYAEGASHEEIAEVLGLRPGSLKSMLFRARRRMADLLGRGAGGGNR